ncbi:transcriptional regulator [Pseudomonas sp. AMR01]|uniref:transcriptional regulator n=1 Tax=Pseudomonas sp. AMR01 TaxID=3064904 RepID=UPI0035C2547A
MSTPDLPGDTSNRQAFLDALVNGDAVHLPLCQGIKLCAMKAGTRPGLSLMVAREALQAGQLQRVLERRFEQAVAFDGCFIYLDARGALVIWQALPEARTALEPMLSRLLSLANLDALDGRLVR